MVTPTNRMIVLNSTMLTNSHEIELHDLLSEFDRVILDFKNEKLKSFPQK